MDKEQSRDWLCIITNAAYYNHVIGSSIINLGNVSSPSAVPRTVGRRAPSRGGTALLKPSAASASRLSGQYPASQAARTGQSPSPHSLRPDLEHNTVLNKCRRAILYFAFFNWKLNVKAPKFTIETFLTICQTIRAK